MVPYTDGPSNAQRAAPGFHDPELPEISQDASG
jgi:hypothetical protein